MESAGNRLCARTSMEMPPTQEGNASDFRGRGYLRHTVISEYFKVSRLGNELGTWDTYHDNAEASGVYGRYGAI